jgi:antitoxin PrlF
LASVGLTRAQLRLWQRKHEGWAIAVVRCKTVNHIAAMKRRSLETVSSKVSVKSQTVIPREVRRRLGVKPGDTLRYRVTDHGVLLDKAPTPEADDPIASLSEWASEADEKASQDL